MFLFTTASTKTGIVGSLSDSIKGIVPGEVEGVLNILGLPFYGPHNGKDVTGQFFSPETDFLEDEIPFPPVFYYHGARSKSRPVRIGRVVGRWPSEKGVWFRVILDMSLPESVRMWASAKAETAYASTGAVPASIDIDRETGWIKQWLVGELSLIDEDESVGRRPANYYAIARPASDAWIKSLNPGILESLQHRFDDVFKGNFLTEEKDMSVKVVMNGKEMTPSEKCDSCLEHNGVAYRRVDSEKCMGCTDAGKCPDCFKAVPTCDCKGCQEKGECPCGPDCPCNKGDSKMNEEEVRKDVKTSTPNTPIVDVKSAPSTEDVRVTSLQAEIRSLKMNMSAQESATWIKTQIQAGRVSPGEEPALMSLMAQAYQADSEAKSGNGSLLSSLKKFVEARPTVSQMATDARVISGAPSGRPEDRVDQAYMDRMKAMI